MKTLNVDTETAGTYTLTVSHQGLLTNDEQDYSLIISSAGFVLSTNSITENVLNIWPNPAKESLNFKFASTSDASCLVELIDLQGRIVYSQNIMGGAANIKGEINTSSYSKGVYFLNLSQGNQKSYKKVVLQ